MKFLKKIKKGFTYFVRSNRGDILLEAGLGEDKKPYDIKVSVPGVNGHLLISHNRKSCKPVIELDIDGDFTLETFNGEELKVRSLKFICETKQ